MRMSFDDKKSFMEAVGSLRFNNPQSGSNTNQQVETQESSDSEDIGFDNPQNDLNTLQRMESSSSSSSQDLAGEEWRFDILIYLMNSLRRKIVEVPSQLHGGPLGSNKIKYDCQWMSARKLFIYFK